jgi:hypothetical protein
MNKTGFLIAAAIVLAGCDLSDLGPSDRFKSDFHYSYDVKPGVRIDAQSFNGDIEISGWDQEKVDVEGTKYGSTEELRDAVRIDISPSPDSITMRAERPSELSGSMGARFVIHAPKSAIAGRITTSNAAIRLSDVTGDGHLRTSNGAIRVQNFQGGVEAQTSNGPIEVSGVRGDAILRSSNGRITGEKVEGDVEARTSNSRVYMQLDHAPAAPIKLETSNGSVELNMQERPKADVRATTNNSGITVRLPSDTSSRISAITSNGSITSDFDVTAHGELSKNRLEGAIGNGGPAITLTTSNGPIRIVRNSGQ